MYAISLQQNSVARARLKGLPEVVHLAKDQFRELIKQLFNYSILSLSRDAQDGLRETARLLNFHRWKMFGLVCAATVAAILEGGLLLPQ